MKNLISWDVATYSGYYGTIENKIVMFEGTFEKCLSEYKKILLKTKNKKEPLKIAFYNDSHGFGHIIKRIAFLKGRIFEASKNIWKGQVYTQYYHENNTFREVFGLKHKITRAMKKETAVSRFRRDHPRKSLRKDDICDAYILYISLVNPS